MVLGDEASARVEALDFDYDAQPKRAVDSCNLCGGTQFTILAHRDRYGFAVETHACSRCGLAFLNPQLTEAGYAVFYERVYRPLVSAFHGRRIDAETVEREQADYGDALATTLAPFLEGRSGIRTLDVGGSTGVVLERLGRRFDLRGTVVDPAPVEVERARARGFEGFVGTIETFAEGREAHDLVVLCQTIDHLQNASGALAKIRLLVHDDGLFFVDIVDFRAAMLRHWSVEAAAKIDHPYSFTESSIEAMLVRAGFEVLRKDYAPDRLHVGYVCAPCDAVDGALPDPGDVRSFMREVRFVQNAGRPS